MPEPRTLVLAFLLTAAIEAAVLFFLARQNGKALIASLVLNAMTNPAANLLFARIAPSGVWIWLVVLAIETMVFAIEAAAYALLFRDPPAAVRWSLLSNAASFVLGSAILPLLTGCILR
ncbi:MAG: hypothetical protein WC509_04245 [Candidatus Izemoplasmatales bacterium]